MKTNTRFITEVAVLTALAIVLDFFDRSAMGFAWINGGSISTSMIPIFILAFRWGLKGGLTGGFILGLVQILLGQAWLLPATSGWWKVIVQAGLDYPIGFMMIGFAGLFSKDKFYTMWAGIVTGGVLRLLSHVLSGVLFFAEYAGDQNPFIYSIIYNSTYMIPSIVLSIIVVPIIVKRVKNI